MCVSQAHIEIIITSTYVCLRLSAEMESEHLIQQKVYSFFHCIVLSWKQVIFDI